MLNLITDNLDVWASAELPAKSGARGRAASNTKSPHGIQKLRELILELAVRGKLVPQDPNDEPASVLLKRIGKEKARLVHEGKLAKQKPLPSVNDEEKRFDLPNGWEWIRVGNLFELEYGSNLPEAKRTNTGEYPVYGSNGVVGSHDSYCVDRPCVVVGRKGSAGALNLCLSNGCWVTDVAYSVVPPADMDLEFVFKLFHTLGLDNLGKGIKPGLNRNEAYVLSVALPPLVEQRRIVAKVDELMALCDQLEQEQTDNSNAHQTLVETLLATLTQAESGSDFAAAWQRIAAHFDTLFTTEQSIDQLKQTILQLAVMGKLVPQDPNDEPASELLKKIAAEKSRLIKEGKIKKQPPLSEISDDEKPFEIPVGWKWCRLGETGIGATGKTPSTKEERFFGGSIPFVGPGQITLTGELLSPDKTLTEDGIEQSTEALPNDILMVCIGGSIGKSVISDKRIAFNQQINAIRPVLVNPVFLNTALSTDIFYRSVLDAATGSATPIINRTKWEELLVPVAPVAEQLRIVAKVDELMSLCDALKARLNEAQITQVQLADAIVEQAVA